DADQQQHRQVDEQDAGHRAFGERVGDGDDDGGGGDVGEQAQFVAHAALEPRDDQDADERADAHAAADQADQEPPFDVHALHDGREVVLDDHAVDLVGEVDQRQRDDEGTAEG